MGCNCGGTRSIGRASNTPSTYRVTLPDGTETVYASPVEARVAVRKAGGGTIRRVTKDV